MPSNSRLPRPSSLKVLAKWLQTILYWREQKTSECNPAQQELLIMPDIPKIPNDLKSELGSETESRLDDFLSRPKSRDSWRGPSSHGPQDINNIDEWDKCIRDAEEAWKAFEGPEDQKVKLAATALHLYKWLLARFPFLTELWRRFLIFTYKVSGLRDSIAVFRLATEEFSQSVSLWVEYLEALLSAGEEYADAHGIDKEFIRAERCIGYNFNSDPFWDLYISHTSKKDDPKHLLDLYLTLIRIPLYQYARYYNQFTEMNKVFDVSEIITDEVQLNERLKAFGKKSASELSALEKQQIIDNYTNSIFTETQRQVNEKWKFESALNVQDFYPSLASEIAEPWLTYLDHEVNILKSLVDGERKGHHCRIVKNLFERSIVPNCFSKRIWSRYVEFAQSYLEFEETKAIYDKAVFKFVPLDEPEIRMKYKSFLMDHGKFDTCNEYIFDLLKIYSGSTGSHIYAKNAYVYSLRLLMELWTESIDHKSLESALESIVFGYFDKVDRYRKSTSPAETQNDVKAKYDLKQVFITLLAKLVNDDGMSVVTVAYLKLLEAAGDAVKIRTFFNKYAQEFVFSYSVQFWKFFIEFEGYNQVNLINLRSIINHIKERSSLPQRAVEAFLDIYHEVICDNLKMAMILKGPNNEDLHDTLIYHDLEKSHGVFGNASAARRMANNNSYIRDLEAQRSAKNNSSHYSPSNFNREQEYRRFAKRHVIHPGIFQDIPEKISPTEDEKFISLLDDNAKVPPPPKYKNVDKAFGPVKYPEE